VRIARKAMTGDTTLLKYLLSPACAHHIVPGRHHSINPF